MLPKIFVCYPPGICSMSAKLLSLLNAAISFFSIDADISFQVLNLSTITSRFHVCNGEDSKNGVASAMAFSVELTPSCVVDFNFHRLKFPRLDSSEADKTTFWTSFRADLSVSKGKLTPLCRNLESFFDDSGIDFDDSTVFWDRTLLLEAAASFFEGGLLFGVAASFPVFWSTDVDVWAAFFDTWGTNTSGFKAWAKVFAGSAVDWRTWGSFFKDVDGAVGGMLGKRWASIWRINKNHKFISCLLLTFKCFNVLRMK